MIINQLNIINFVLILLFIININVINCLYEDQVGKFDWKQSYIGKLKFTEFDSVKRIVVGTDENVVASLQLKNGQIVWRHTLENKHNLELLHLGNEVVTVSGDGNTFYVRGWDLNYGILEFEWTVQLENENIYSKWLIHNDKLIHLVPILNSHVEISTYHYNTGHNNGSTLRVQTNWVKDLDKCLLAGIYWSCLDADNGDLFMMDITNNKPFVYKKQVDHLIGNTTGSVHIKPCNYPESALILFRNNVLRKVVLKDNDAYAVPYGFNNEFISLQNGDDNMLIEINNNVIRMINIEENHEDAIQILDTNLDISLMPVAGICRGQACRLFVKGIDDSISLIQLPTGKILWTREEALSNVLSVKFIELPLSEMDASIEHEFTSTDNVVGMFIKRITSQLKQITSYLSGQQLTTNNRNLIRDDFGFHKLIIVATKVGKVYSLDSLTGEIIWSKFLRNIQPFRQIDDKEYYVIFEQRSARYFPLPAVCTLIAKDSSTNYGVSYTFDPITGDSQEENLKKFNFKIKQLMLTPYEDYNHLKGIILMSDTNEVNVYPENSIKILQEYGNSLYMYNVNYLDGDLEGYSLQLNQYKDIVKATKTWEIHLDPSKIIAHSVKPEVERVHSQGRVLHDRSVLYKYVNPNLMAIATLTQDPIHKNVLSVYLIDGVTGLIIYSVNHKRAKGPIKLVHSENWIVYSYLNEKFRRNEIVSIELYEGITQSNSTAFSSFSLSQLPHAESQAYILPVNPQIITTTLTERGITNKHLLLALSGGYVAELPWAILEPRGTQLSAGPEEGYNIPYIPELPIPPESFINYNQTLERINGIYVSPARLESTSLVLVYGLDLFFTRVAPSKTFDVLKEDFDHWLIVTVLSGLIIASYITKQLASRKALKQAWK